MKDDNEFENLKSLGRSIDFHIGNMMSIGHVIFFLVYFVLFPLALLAKCGVPIPGAA